jgi:hypothetical protein
MAGAAAGRIGVCPQRNVLSSQATVGQAQAVPELMDIAIGDLHLALRLWQAVDEDKTPIMLLHATGETARDWDVIASGLRADRTVYAVVADEPSSGLTGSHPYPLGGDGQTEARNARTRSISSADASGSYASSEESAKRCWSPG